MRSCNQQSCPVDADCILGGVSACAVQNVVATSRQFMKRLILQSIPGSDGRKAQKEKAILATICDFSAQPGTVSEMIGNCHGPEPGELVDSSTAELVQAMLTVEALVQITAEELHENVAF